MYSCLFLYFIKKYQVYGNGIDTIKEGFDIYHKIYSPENKHKFKCLAFQIKKLKKIILINIMHVCKINYN